MKRGNTALKRGVGLASAFALAIAGAVIAAPAANATPDGTHAVRATPQADANYVGADGVAGSYNGAGTYSLTHATGTALTVKANATQQVVNNFQVVIPAGTAAGDLKVTLDGAGITFAAPPAVVADSVARVLTSFNLSAGFDGTNAHVGTAVSPSVATPTNFVGQPTLANSNQTVVVPLAAAPAATGGGYLLSFNGVIVSTTGLSGAAATPITVDLAATGQTSLGSLAGKTTLGYAVPVNISSASDAVEADSNGPTNTVTLPDLVLTESYAGAFSGSISLNVTGGTTVETGSGAGQNADLKATVSGAGLSGATAAVANDGDPVVITISGTSASAGTITLSGLKLKTVAKDDDVDIAIDGSGADSVDHGAGTNFSAVPDLDDAAVTVSTTVPEPRIAGDDRYDTAAQIAAKIVTPGTTDAIILANGENAKQGVDALAANYLAKAKSTAILLTSANSLPLATQTALVDTFKGFSQAAKSITIYVLGKSDSVSDAVRNQAKSLVKSAATAVKSVDVVEIAGSNRYDTSAAVAQEVGVAGLSLHSLTTTGTWLRTAFLASGKVNADALAAGSIAAAAGIPVLLADGDAVNEKVADTIKSLGIKQVVVLGGTDRISAALVSSLADLGVTSTKRIAESDRYKTAAALYTWAFAAVNPTGTETNRGLGWNTTGSKVAYIANGTDGFADALAVGPLAGKSQSPILTTAVASLSDAAVKFLKDNKAQFVDGIWALGKADRVSSDVITAAQAAIK